jgi:biopolymer transport protein ExbB/biopolymer transport protein TolQ
MKRDEITQEVIHVGGYNLTAELLRIAYMGAAWVLYLLILLSVLSVASMVERIIWFYRNTRGSAHLQDRLRKGLQAGGLAGARQVLDTFARGARRGEMTLGWSLEARVLRRALPWASGGPEALAEAVESEFSVERKGLDSGTNLLGTLGNNAPFIGLFGTCIGVIQAFSALGTDSTEAGMGNVMVAIAEALVATAVGIFVAIPAVVAYNMCQKSIGTIEGRVHGLSKLLTAHLHSLQATPGGQAHMKKE